MFYIIFIGHPARIGNYVNMKYDPAWQNCSDDTQVSAIFLFKLSF